MFEFPVDDEIELRLHEEWHAEELFELTDRNRQHLQRWFPWVEKMQDSSDSLAFIRRTRQRWADNKGLHTSVWFRGEMAGTLGLIECERQVKAVEIGYWLGKKFEGRGIITRSCRALIEFAFDRMDVNRMVLRCSTENERSAAVARRLGFTHEGTEREAGRIGDRMQDVDVYSMLAREWSC